MKLNAYRRLLEGLSMQEALSCLLAFSMKLEPLSTTLYQLLGCRMEDKLLEVCKDGRFSGGGLGFLVRSAFVFLIAIGMLCWRFFGQLRGSSFFSGWYIFYPQQHCSHAG